MKCYDITCGDGGIYFEEDNKDGEWCTRKDLQRAVELLKDCGPWLMMLLGDEELVKGDIEAQALIDLTNKNQQFLNDMRE